MKSAKAAKAPKITKSKMDRREGSRKEISPLEFTGLSSLENLTKLSKFGYIVQASKTGILLKFKREDIVPTSLRRSLTLDPLIGTRVFFHLPQMNLEISGIIARTKLLGKAGFEIAIDYSEDAPEYWRECLLDLLPLPGEFEDEDHLN